MTKGKRIAWVTSWDRICGIADYSKILFPKAQAAAYARGASEVALFSLDAYPNPSKLMTELSKSHWDIVHIQHEFGLFGGKTPGFYWFPKWLKDLRAQSPTTKIVATAHTVIPPNYRYSTDGFGIASLMKHILNSIGISFLKKFWNQKTWGSCDGVITHAAFLNAWISPSPTLRIVTIPHFVPEVETHGTTDTGLLRITEARLSKKDIFLVFGFFSEDKGQDIAIDLFAEWKKRGNNSGLLVLAGGARRTEDLGFLEICRNKIRQLGLENDVCITDYVQPEKIDAFYRASDVVIVPFRKTSGSGSLAQAFARSSVILGSDLPLHNEVVRSYPDCMALFHPENLTAAADTLTKILGDSQYRQRLRTQSNEVALGLAPSKIAEKTLDFYEQLFSNWPTSVWGNEK